MLYTIRNERTGRVKDVTPEAWVDLQTRSRGWKKVGEIGDKPAKKEKSAAKQKDHSDKEEILPEWTEATDSSEEE